MADVRFIVTVDSATATANIQKLDDAWKKVDTTHKDVAKSSGLVESKLSSMWKQFAAGMFIVDGARKLFGLVKGEFVDSIKQAADYEKSLKGLNSAFSISGRTMPGMADNLRKYANELQKLGLAEDDEILKSESLLLQLTNLNEKGIKAAERGAIGLAAVFGTDLQTATEQVAKGMEGNFTMLQRLIPAIRNATTEEGKRAAMMKTFEDLYKRAIADTETYAGQVKKLGLEWKDAKQQLGESILSTGVLQDTMTGLTVILNSITGKSGRDYKAWLTDSIAANNAAGESLRRMAEKIGWTERDLVLLRLQYDLSSVELIDWIQNNQFGTKAAAALAAVLKDQAAELEKGKKGFTETGEALDAVAVHVKRLEKHYEKLNDDLRILRMFGPMNISPPVIDKKGTLGEIIGGDLGKVVDYVETVEGLFVGLKTSVVTTTTDLAAQLSALSSQMFGDMINGFTAIMDGSKTMGEFFSSIVTTMIADLGKLVLAEMLFAKGSIMAAQMQAVAHFIASIFKKVPFPLNIALAVGAFALVSTLFKKLLKFEEGGVFTKPTIAEVGHGTEYVLPEKKLIDLVRGAVTGRGPMSGGGAPLALAGAGVTCNFYGPLIQTTGLSDADVRRAGNRFKAEIDWQMRRLGRATNG